MKTLTRSARGECIRYDDQAALSSRQAWIDNNRLDRILFIGQRLPPRDWLVAAFAEQQLSDQTRRFLLHGRAPGVALDTTPIVCACAGVTAARLNTSIADGARTLEAIGEVTRAGVTCGSCRPAMAALLAETVPSEDRNAA
jgi:assimilatory nitrate reductase catalytic subunit